MAVGAKFVDTGQAFVIDLIDLNTRGGVAGTFFGAWGSDGTTPAVTDTALIAANPEARTAILAAAMSQQTTQSAGDTVRWTYTIVATGTRTVQETGIFTASSGGTMLIRIVHGSLALESGDSVAYTVNMQLRDSSGT